MYSNGQKHNDLSKKYMICCNLHFHNIKKKDVHNLLLQLDVLAAITVLLHLLNISVKYLAINILRILHIVILRNERKQNDQQKETKCCCYWRRDRYAGYFERIKGITNSFDNACYCC